ncbi:MAG: tRNA guanosine(34) transglycosylase Tgt [Verrucomicrobiae bacterium]|nr:tRNA guanosine(34) transglycosylase Tgt [Verrucomicrobiae bacterium]
MFQLTQTDGLARLGSLTTGRGEFPTPAFMPVGTQGSVKGTSPRELGELGVPIILGNTYHLMIRPGLPAIRHLGGLHGFSGWSGPILTDSGGYQVFSLAPLREISDAGVAFRSHVDGAPLFLGPREALEAQADLGSDIAMLFDECPPWAADGAAIARAVDRTLSWARESRRLIDAWRDEGGVLPAGQRHFAIVQGGASADLRAQCAAELVALRFDGYAIGGVSVGEPEDMMFAAVDATAPHLPADRPRYAMGLGMPHQIVELVARGVDLFDCVLPTRMARHGSAFTWDGLLHLHNAPFALDPSPIETGCACYACQTFSRAYIRHLLKSREILGLRLVTLHNLHFYMRLMAAIRDAIAGGCFGQFRRDAVARLRSRETGECIDETTE